MAEETVPDALPEMFRRMNPFGGSYRQTQVPSARAPVHKKSEVYNMSHRRRGVALLFNHLNFVKLKRRDGTNEDRNNLRQTLGDLHFEVRVFDDPSLEVSIRCGENLSK